MLRQQELVPDTCETMSPPRQATRPASPSHQVKCPPAYTSSSASSRPSRNCHGRCGAESGETHRGEATGEAAPPEKAGADIDSAAVAGDASAHAARGGAGEASMSAVGAEWSWPAECKVRVGAVAVAHEP